MKSMQQLFEESLQDLYNAEKQLVKALPKLAKAANDQQLRETIEQHLERTKEHAARIEDACKILKIKPTGVTCHGMMGLVQEADEHVKDVAKSEVGDAEIIACAQKAEHYEICAYGTLITWCEQMGNHEVADLLKRNMSDEEDADKTLTDLAESRINQAAVAAGAQSQEDMAGAKKPSRSMKEKVSVK